MKSRRLAFAMLAAVAVAVSWLGLSGRNREAAAPQSPPRASLPERDRSRRPPTHRDVATASDEVNATRTPPAPPAADVMAPSSPKGAIPRTPGLATDASGSFYPEASTVEWIESRIAASPSVEQADREMRAQIASSLEPPAEQEALDFLERYLAYRKRGIELGLNRDVTEDFRPRFAQLRSLRREFFGMDIGQRVFGEEEREANIALREHEIMNDPDLSDDERALLLDELYNPPPERNE